MMTMMSLWPAHYNVPIKFLWIRSNCGKLKRTARYNVSTFTSQAEDGAQHICIQSDVIRSVQPWSSPSNVTKPFLQTLQIGRNQSLDWKAGYLLLTWNRSSLYQFYRGWCRHGILVVIFITHFWLSDSKLVLWRNTSMFLCIQLCYNRQQWKRHFTCLSWNGIFPYYHAKMAWYCKLDSSGLGNGPVAKLILFVQ